MKKIVAMLLVVATLCLPLCGLADTDKTVEAIFALTDGWEYVNTVETIPENAFYIIWVPSADCLSFTYNQKIFVYTGYRAELLMATATATALADDSLAYGIDWQFAVNDKGYSKVQAMMYVLEAADKYLN